MKQMTHQTNRAGRHPAVTSLLALALAALTSAAGATEPLAIQPPPSEGDWEFQIAPYMWALALDGDVTVKGVTAPVEEDFSDILKALKWTVMLEAEVRKDRLGLFASVLGAQLKGSSEGVITTTDVRLTMWETQFGVDYRLGPYALGSSPRAPQVTIDPLVGGRFFSLDTEISPGGFPSTEDTTSWIDPLVGVRTVWDLNRRWNIILAGNVGGFGVGSDLSWEALGTIGYRFNLFRKLPSNVMLGYRALSQDYTSGSGRSLFEFDATMHGPILGLAINF